jgi:hypothetical protein
MFVAQMESNMRSDPTGNLDDHVRQAQQKLEAATTSLNAAQEAFVRNGDEATTRFLEDAQTAYEEARAAYDLAVGAQATGDGATTGGVRGAGA